MAAARQLTSLAAAQPPLFIGVDVGGTNIKVGLVDDCGRTLAYLTVPTEVELGPEEGARRMAAAADEVIRQAGATAEAVKRVGLATPGTMDIPAGMLLEPPNLRGWWNFPIRDALGRCCGLDVTFANDAGAAAFGEYWCGTGRDFRSMVLLTLGTGIGCGIIVDGVSLDGQHSHGAECGHIIIDYHEKARICACGQPGHLEAYTCAAAIVGRTRDLLDTGRVSSIAERLAQGAELTPRVVAEEAEAGDALAEEVILEAAEYLGVGIVSLLHTIDPDGVVLAGGMNFGGNASPVGRAFLGRVREEVAKRAFPIVAARVTIDYAALGSDAGYIGAAGLARRDFCDARQAAKPT